MANGMLARSCCCLDSALSEAIEKGQQGVARPESAEALAFARRRHIFKRLFFFFSLDS
jgi:hypothetical protein